MANRFYTILVVPEKTSDVKRIVIPSWVLKSSAAIFALVSLVAIIMVLDYWYVMNQIGENKQLKLENRRLKQQVQVFKNKISTVENTLDRVKTFVTRLKVITNVEDRGNLLQSLNSTKLPEAGSNIGGTNMPKNQILLTTAAPASPLDPEEEILKKEFQILTGRCEELDKDSLYVEQMLQNQYELLADQKAFLAALPTRKPAVGYFTSGFGVRKSPYGGRIKMHEGLDIANRPGTPIRAPADGVVTFCNTKAGYGQTVIIDHGYGLETWYGHTRKILVAKGQKVRRGDPVALLGNSGRSTGPHVHYEVRVHGTPVDPLSYILEN